MLHSTRPWSIAPAESAEWLPAEPPRHADADPEVVHRLEELVASLVGSPVFVKRRASDNTTTISPVTEHKADLCEFPDHLFIHVENRVEILPLQRKATIPDFRGQYDRQSLVRGKPTYAHELRTVWQDILSW